MKKTKGKKKKKPLTFALLKSKCIIYQDDAMRVQGHRKQDRLELTGRV